MKKKDALLYRFARPIITVLFKIFFTPKIIGRDNIPNSGRIILAGNHTSNFDCLLLISSTKRSIHFLAKKELWKGPKKIIFGNMGLIPVDRTKKDHSSLEKAEAYLKEEQLIGIFPEGTTEKEKMKMLPFKMGAIKMARDTNTEIIPFSITGDYSLFSRNLKIVFGKPISIIENNLEREKEKLEETIKTLMRGDL
ncbi:MAG: 1-acyl-sn-glycerol-3-phosphate acyltransferase [Bacilli bacterium]|nr:1-acyl-sn-glycerol-3-phosphate acyltransferase [Bacilli bacterium]